MSCRHRRIERVPARNERRPSLGRHSERRFGAVDAEPHARRHAFGILVGRQPDIRPFVCRQLDHAPLEDARGIRAALLVAGGYRPSGRRLPPVAYHAQARPVLYRQRDRPRRYGRADSGLLPLARRYVQARPASGARSCGQGTCRLPQHVASGRGRPCHARQSRQGGRAGRTVREELVAAYRHDARVGRILGLSEQPPDRPFALLRRAALEARASADDRFGSGVLLHHRGRRFGRFDRSPATRRERYTPHTLCPAPFGDRLAARA